MKRDFKVYGFAIFTSLWAAFLTHWISPVLGNTFFEFFHVAVVLSAFFGGLGPGILSATLCFFIIDYFFMLPAGTFVLGPHLLRLIIFEAVAILTSLLSGKLRESTEFLERAHHELENSILEINSREQRRLGQDLHDGLCQTLAGTRLVVENLKEKAPSAQRADLENVEAQLTDALTQADTIARGLHPVELEANGLLPALNELASKTARIYSIDCRFVSDKPVSSANHAVAMHLYRIAQEAVANAVKSGKADQITIRLNDEGSRVVLEIQDNGIGFKTGQVRKGMGLQLMNYRAHMMNGVLDFNSSEGNGTRVRCYVPKKSLEESFIAR